MQSTESHIRPKIGDSSDFEGYPLPYHCRGGDRDFHFRINNLQSDCMHNISVRLSGMNLNKWQ